MLKWKWWKKKSSADSLLAVTASGSNFTLAKVQWGESGKPELLECALQSQLSDTQTTLKQLTANHDVTGSPAVSVMEPGNFDLILMEAPNVPAEEMNDAVRWQIKDRISYSPEDAIIQTFEIPGQMERGRTPMVYTVTADRKKVTEQINLLEEQKIDLEYIDIPELVQRNVAMFCPEDAIGVAMLRLQESSGLLTVTHQGELYLTRQLDTGYLGMLEEQKLEHSDEGGLQLAETDIVADKVYDQVVLEIQRSLDYYESHFSKIPIGSLVIAPLPVEIPGLDEKLSGLLGIQVRELDLNEIVTPHVPLDREKQAQCFTAIGAALRWSTNMAVVASL